MNNHVLASLVCGVLMVSACSKEIGHVDDSLNVSAHPSSFFVSSSAPDSRIKINLEISNSGSRSLWLLRPSQIGAKLKAVRDDGHEFLPVMNFVTYTDDFLENPTLLELPPFGKVTDVLDLETTPWSKGTSVGVVLGLIEWSMIIPPGRYKLFVYGQIWFRQDKETRKRSLFSLQRVDFDELELGELVVE